MRNTIGTIELGREFTLSDLSVGDRVNLHGPSPALFGQWATVVSIGRKFVHVQPNWSRTVRIHPGWVSYKQLTHNFDS